VSRATLDTVSSFDFSPTGFSPSSTCFSKTFQLNLMNTIYSPNPKGLGPLVWPLTLSLAATQVIDVSFSSFGYLDVSVPRVPPAWLFIHHAVTGLFPAGFPHSVISGSMAICASPKLFAAYHDLLRLLVPRHPPYALISLNLCFKSIIQKCIMLWFCFHFVDDSTQFPLCLVCYLKYIGYIF
jgi:hypothetical protein